MLLEFRAARATTPRILREYRYMAELLGAVGTFDRETLGKLAACDCSNTSWPIELKGEKNSGLFVECVCQ